MYKSAINSAVTYVVGHKEAQGRYSPGGQACGNRLSRRPSLSSWRGEVGQPRRANASTRGTVCTIRLEQRPDCAVAPPARFRRSEQ